MGFIRAALSAGLNSFNDSKFKEAIVLQIVSLAMLWPLRDNYSLKTQMDVLVTAIKILDFCQMAVWLSFPKVISLFW